MVDYLFTFPAGAGNIAAHKAAPFGYFACHSVKKVTPDRNPDLYDTAGSTIIAFNPPRSPRERPSVP